MSSHLSHRFCSHFKPWVIKILIRLNVNSVLVWKELKGQFILRYFVFVLLNRDQSIREERILRDIILRRLKGLLRRWRLYFFLELQRDSLGRYPYFLTLNPNGLDGIAETNDLLLHFLWLWRLFADNGFKEGFLGVDLNIWQFADIQERYFIAVFFH